MIQFLKWLLFRYHCWTYKWCPKHRVYLSFHGEDPYRPKWGEYYYCWNCEQEPKYPRKPTKRDRLEQRYGINGQQGRQGEGREERPGE